MDTRVADLKNKLKAGRSIVGTHIALRDSCITELYGEVGFDFVWIDTEHTALDKQEVLGHLIAAKASGTVGIVRIPWNDPVLAKPILDMGADGIIFPFICSRDEAEGAMASCSYPPKGIRGYGPNRAMRYGLVPQAEYCAADDGQIFKIIQIEHITGVNNIEEILDVPGIDAVVIGAQDLSGSLGKIGQIYDEEENRCIDRIVSACRRRGVNVGISCGYDLKFIQSFVDRGVNILTIELDYGYILRGAMEVYERAHRMFEGERFKASDGGIVVST